MDEQEPRHDEPVEGHDDAAGPVYDRSSAAVLRPREPFVRWVRGLDPAPEGEPVTVDREPVVVLVPRFSNEEDADLWLREHYGTLFAFELRAWCRDEQRWPADRSWDVFSAWFDVTWSATVVDCSHVGVPPFDCPPLSLRQVIEELANVPDHTALFVDTRTGGLLLLTDEQVDAALEDRATDPARPEGWRDVVDAARDGFQQEYYIEIDNPYLLDDRALMETFAGTAPAPASVRNRLADALQAKKARKRFEEVVDRSNLRSEWEGFMRESVAETMRAWLDAVGLPFANDVE
jgi:hypothetical protein